MDCFTGREAELDYLGGEGLSTKGASACRGRASGCKYCTESDHKISYVFNIVAKERNSLVVPRAHLESTRRQSHEYNSGDISSFVFPCVPLEHRRL